MSALDSDRPGHVVSRSPWDCGSVPPPKVWDVEGRPCRWEGNDGAYVPGTRSQVAASAGGWAPQGLRRSREAASGRAGGVDGPPQVEEEK